jgi:hypothetical protein
MLKDYADQIISLGFEKQSVRDLYDDAFSYLNDYPMFTSYSSALKWCKNHVVGCFVRHIKSPLSKIMFTSFELIEKGFTTI